MEICNLFLSLVRIALGKEERFAYAPSNEEWHLIYQTAWQQGLVGICFAGVEKLYGQNQVPPRDLLIEWLGQAEYIKRRNRLFNQYCLDIQSKLAKDGFKSFILKGQGISKLYNQLSDYRASGDIDVYVSGGMNNVLNWCNNIMPISDFDYSHVKMNYYPDTLVEIHYRYGVLFNPILNKRLQVWFDNNNLGKKIVINNHQLNVPSDSFNAVYLIHHIYRHLFAGGINLRQIMDYYYFLNSTDVKIIKEQTEKILKEFKLLRLSSAIMWILNDIFHMPKEKLICEPCEAEGKYLLKEIITTNSLNSNEQSKNGVLHYLYELIHIIRYSFHLFLHYNNEVFWVPVWHVYHFFWKRKKKLELSLNKLTNKLY